MKTMFFLVIFSFLPSAVFGQYSILEDEFSPEKIVETDLNGIYTTGTLSIHAEIESFYFHPSEESDTRYQIFFYLMIGQKMQTIIRKNGKFLHVGAEKNWTMSHKKLRGIHRAQFFFTHTIAGVDIFQKVVVDDKIYTSCCFYGFIMPNGKQQLELKIPGLPILFLVGRDIVRMPEQYSTSYSRIAKRISFCKLWKTNRGFLCYSAYKA